MRVDVNLEVNLSVCRCMCVCSLVSSLRPDSPGCEIKSGWRPGNKAMCVCVYVCMRTCMHMCVFSIPLSHGPMS